ncbi:MAG: GDP-mannose 4,6-dehydratase [Vulcanimicrobiaceae bacterium]
MRVLVTGGNGFVGRHLCAELRRRGCDVVVAGRIVEEGHVDLPLDLGDLDSVRGVVEAARARTIFHLAAQAFVPAATSDPIPTYDTNVVGTARVVEAIRRLPDAARPRLLYISSGEVYGTHEAADYPLRETAQTLPATPYAASKLAAEAIVGASARSYGLSAIVTRAFNHIGPGQDASFVVAAFARRLAAIAAGGDPRLPVGNLEPQRDFLDVRDVVRAYADLAERGVSGETYNICSGTPTKIQEILRQLVMAARVGVEIREDPALVRPSDVPLYYGDNAKLVAATGWAPQYTLARSLRDVYAEARAATSP